jgi:hypothetical protein
VTLLKRDNLTVFYGLIKEVAIPEGDNLVVFPLEDVSICRLLF